MQRAGRSLQSEPNGRLCKAMHSRSLTAVMAQSAQSSAWPFIAPTGYRQKCVFEARKTSHTPIIDWLIYAGRQHPSSL